MKTVPTIFQYQTTNDSAPAPPHPLPRPHNSLPFLVADVNESVVKYKRQEKAISASEDHVLLTSMQLSYATTETSNG